MPAKKDMEKEEAILADRYGDYEISTQEYYDALSELQGGNETQLKED